MVGEEINNIVVSRRITSDVSDFRHIGDLVGDRGARFQIMRKVGIIVITGTEDMKKRLAKNFFFEQVITKLVDCVHHEFVLRVMSYIGCSKLAACAKEEGERFHDEEETVHVGLQSDFETILW